METGLSPIGEQITEMGMDRAVEDFGPKTAILDKFHKIVPVVRGDSFVKLHRDPLNPSDRIGGRTERNFVFGSFTNDFQEIARLDFMIPENAVQRYPRESFGNGVSGSF